MPTPHFDDNDRCRHGYYADDLQIEVRRAIAQQAGVHLGDRCATCRRPCVACPKCGNGWCLSRRFTSCCKVPLLPGDELGVE